MSKIFFGCELSDKYYFVETEVDFMSVSELKVKIFLRRYDVLIEL